MNYLNELYNYVNNSEVIGLTRELNVFYVNQYFESHDDNVLVLANSLYEANYQLPPPPPPKPPPENPPSPPEKNSPTPPDSDGSTTVRFSETT